MNNKPYERIDCIQKYSHIKSILVYSNNISFHDISQITIVIPTYKRETMLIRAINSIINQISNINFSIIIVDNELHSIDGSDFSSFLKSIKSIKISYYQNEKNIGMFGNWNRCIELASTKWVAMLHDDDYLLETYFQNLESVMSFLTNDVGYIKASTIANTRRGKCGLVEFTKNDFYFFGPCRIGYLGTPSCGSIFNRDIFMKSGGFNEKHYPSEDAYFITSLCVDSGYKIYKTIMPMGVIDQDDSLTYKQNTIIAFAKEFPPYFKFYSSWGSIPKFFYTFFYNEIYFQEKKQIKKLIFNNRNINNQDEILSVVDEILKKESFNIIKYFLLLLIYKVHNLIINIKHIMF